MVKHVGLLQNFPQDIYSSSRTYIHSSTQVCLLLSRNQRIPTNLCVDPLLHVHGSARHVIDLVLDVGHGFVRAPDDTHEGNLGHMSCEQSNWECSTTTC